SAPCGTGLQRSLKIGEYPCTHKSADAEGKQRQWNIGLRQADLAQRAGEVKPVQQVKSEGHKPWPVRGETRLPAVRSNDLAGQEKNAQRNRRFKRRSGHVHHPASQGSYRFLIDRSTQSQSVPASFDARRSMVSLVACLATGMLDDPLLVARYLRRSKLERQLVDLAGELERQLVAVIHARAGINADVEGLVDRHQERNRVRDRLAGNLLAVYRQHAGAALAKAGAIILEIEHDGVLAGFERGAQPVARAH